MIVTTFTPFSLRTMEVAVSSFLTALCVVIAYLVNSTVQEPYMVSSCQQ